MKSYTYNNQLIQPIIIWAWKSITSFLSRNPKNDKYNRESGIISPREYCFCRSLPAPPRFFFMKFIRSTKCSLKFATAHKRQELTKILTEYGRVCTIFIEHFWGNSVPSKSKLLKDIVDLPQDTWLSARLRKVAAREAIDMVIATRERWKDKPNKMSMPVHKGQRMYVSCTIAELQDKDTAGFDAWLHLASIGNNIILDLPIKFHKHFNKLKAQGKRLNSYIITEKYVQLCFEIEKEKRKGLLAIGIDTGINAMASLNNGHQFGLDIKPILERIKRCQHGSEGQKQARRALKQRMDEVILEIFTTFKNVDCIVVEKLKNLNYKTKFRRRLNKNMRRSIGAWAYRYWLRRVELACQMNRVHFRTTPPQYTSQICPVCGHIDRGNRSGQEFLCLNCGHAGNADVNAGRNILDRFLTGPYGAGYKPYEVMNNHC